MEPYWALSFFSIDINDIVNVITHSKIVLYADDTILLCSADSTNKIKLLLDRDLICATDWLYKNKLHLNIKKCKWTLFGSNKRLKQSVLPDIKLNNVNIEHVDSYKYLGLHIDNHLNWELHVDYICKKVRQRLGVLKRVRDCLNDETALKLYNALIMPIIDYCDVTYSLCSAKSTKKLDRLMAKGGKILLKLPYDTQSRKVLNNLKWMYFKERSYFHRCVQMYKCVNTMCPEYLSCKFKNISHYNTRQVNNLNTIKCKTSMGQRSFTYSGAHAWNDLPGAIKLSPSISVFKDSVIKYIIKSR